MAMPSGVPRRPVVLIILDGFGINPSKRHNAIELAKTPNLDRYFSSFPHTTLQPSGPGVGLPDGLMGNSKVGHMILGAASIIRQDIVHISAAIADGSFFSNPVLVSAAQRAAACNRPVHLFGLVSDGGVHSDLGHLVALIELCRVQGARPLLHFISDGRDTAPKAALTYIQHIEPLLQAAGGAIASLTGRYSAMDRDKRWERTELAWRAWIHGKGQQAPSAKAAIYTAYDAGKGDEFIKPMLMPDFMPMASEDEAICFNFRKDRPQQIIDALCLPGFQGFDRGNSPRPRVSCMMPYN